MNSPDGEPGKTENVPSRWTSEYRQLPDADTRTVFDMTTVTYKIEPLNLVDATKLRSTSGRTYVADSKPGYPCRQCLRDAEIGDELLLVSHDPFLTDSPYRSASPIFIHTTPCHPGNLETLPEQLTIRQLSVRAFDANAMMTNAVLTAGKDLDPTLSSMFTDPAVVTVHVHNAGRGCWATNIVRS